MQCAAQCSAALVLLLHGSKPHDSAPAVMQILYFAHSAQPAPAGNKDAQPRGLLGGALAARCTLPGTGCHLHGLSTHTLSWQESA